MGPFNLYCDSVQIFSCPTTQSVREGSLSVLDSEVVARHPVYQLGIVNQGRWVVGNGGSGASRTPGLGVWEGRCRPLLHEAPGDDDGFLITQ